MWIKCLVHIVLLLRKLLKTFNRNDAIQVMRCSACAIALLCIFYFFFRCCSVQLHLRLIVCAFVCVCHSVCAHHEQKPYIKMSICLFRFFFPLIHKQRVSHTVEIQFQENKLSCRTSNDQQTLTCTYSAQKLIYLIFKWIQSNIANSYWMKSAFAMAALLLHEVFAWRKKCKQISLSATHQRTQLIYLPCEIIFSLPLPPLLLRLFLFYLILLTFFLKIFMIHEWIKVEKLLRLFCLTDF